MNILYSIIEMVDSFGPFFKYALFYLYAAAFLATVPFILDKFFRR